MQHFLELESLSQESVIHLVQRARAFKASPKSWPCFPLETLATLFWEPSTRTRISFELAAYRLGMQVVNLDLAKSSETKGETMEDTFRTLMAMGIGTIAIRHQEDQVPHKLAGMAGSGCHVVNAGDGCHAHPSQGMLDIMTIAEDKPDFGALKIAIVGDIRHSRVAHSLDAACKIMGVGELVLVAPLCWQPTRPMFGRITDSLEEGLSSADVVVGLRVQRERLGTGEMPPAEAYRQDYALTRTRMAQAKPDAILLHPGPVNRGVEIDPDVADGPQSRILEQVSNGVFMRMAILEALLKSMP